MSAKFQPPPWAVQSGEQTADALIVEDEGFFYGIIVTTDGTNDVTVAIYDNNTASGTKLIPDVVCAGGTRYHLILFEHPVPFDNGIYVDVTTLGTTSYMVYYQPKP